MFRRSTFAAAFITIAGLGLAPARRVSVAPGPNITWVMPTSRLVGTRTPLISAKVTAGALPLSPSSVTLIWDRAGAIPPDTIQLFSPDINNAISGRYTIDTTFRSAVMEWQPDSAHGLNPGSGGDSALVTIKACDNGDPGTCKTSTQWAVIPNDSTAVLGFANVPVENLTPSFSAPFGPGISVSGAEVETGFGSVPYFSMGAARSAGLVYSTRQSYPRVLVPVDLALRWPVSVAPTRVVTRLFDGAVKLDSLVDSTGACVTGSIKSCRVVLQGDYSGSAISVPVRKNLTVEVSVTSGGLTRTSSSPVEAVLVDRRTTGYGSGWWPAGASKLVADGDNRILVAPNGTATIFRGNADQVYLSPPGSTSTLTRTATGWELTSLGTKAKAVFDSLGRLQAAVDANGNRDSIAYVSTTDAVAALVDPVGKQISFTYAGGVLTTITSLPGEPGERKTSVTIDTASGELTYDSLSSPTAKPYVSHYSYQTYPGTKTKVLTRRLGVITDTTVVVYDSAFFRRPVQARLPVVVNPATGSNATPTITYTAMESRGFHIPVRVDSAGPYVEMKDPLGHWTRSWVNRWGQARLSWDSLGILSRALYSDNGYLQWTTGKNQTDTTRAYYAYSGSGLLLKQWIVRPERGGSILRTDSLVYDVNYRPIRHIDSRGKVDSVHYDANGNVTDAWDQAGNPTKTWYRGDGLVDSVAPATGGVVRYAYDATWKQRVSTKLSGATPTILDSTAYDSYGRPVESGMRKDHMPGGSLWQWRRAVAYLTVANEVDSTWTQLSIKCTGTCSSPTAWGTIVDRGGVRRDRAGRDSVRISASGGATVYLYDRLGRLLSRRPPSSAGTPPRDSMVYDLAGNVVKTITRRGDTITATYDSRNRSLTTVVPGYGTINRAYSGPLDQLTRIWVTSPVDSIGGVNPELRYTYDARGRLKVDTSYAGTVALATTHEYDLYERDSVTTDPRGAWRVSYDATRGLPARLVTPFGDSLSYSYDGLGRFSQRTLLSSGSQVQYTVAYSNAGALQSVQTTVGTGGSAWTPGTWDATGQSVDEGPPLGPNWTWQKGSGVAKDTLVDSLAADAEERMLNWRQFGGVSLLAGDSASYDSQINILTAGGSEVYDTLSQRLTARAEAGGTWAYSYDAAGNQTQAQWTKTGSTTKTWVYGYDALDRLVSARYNGTLVARYAYDVLGRRIVKRVYSASTGGVAEYRRFVYADDHVAQERDSAGTTVSIEYTWGNTTDDLVGFRVSGTQQYYVSSDKLGSVRGVWKRDGTWIMRQSFKPYGERFARDSSGAVPALRYGWTGREYDAETGLYYFRARYYELGQRRFIQEDPIGFGGSANLYAYVDGAATESRDPSGLLKDAEMFGGNPHDWTGSGFSSDGSRICDMFCGMGGGTWGERASRNLQTWAYLASSGFDDYLEYKRNYDVLKKQSAVSKDPIVKEMFKNAEALEVGEFMRLTAAAAHVLGLTSDEYGWVSARFSNGEFFKNGTYVLRYRTDPDVPAVTQRGLTALDMYTIRQKALGDRALANILLHETLHSRGGMDHCDIYRYANVHTGYEMPIPSSLNCPSP